MTIEKRGDGYRVKIRILGVSESQSGFETKAAARMWKSKRETEIREASAAGIAVNERTRHTLREALAKYRDNEAQDKRGARVEVIRLNRMLKDADLPLDDDLARVTPDRLSTWSRKRGRQVQPASLRREAVQLSSVYTTARRVWRWLPANHENPCSRMWLPPQPAPRSRVVADDERDRVLAALGYQNDGPVGGEVQQTGLAFLIALETAMRTSEILGLAWRHFDPVKRVAYLEVTKNGHGREVPLTREAVRLLQRCPPGKPTEPMFSLSAVVCDVLFRRARDSLKPDDSARSLTFRDSRATALTRLSKKVDALTLAKISGHRDLKILLNTYYRVTGEDMAKMIDD